MRFFIIALLFVLIFWVARNFDRDSSESGDERELVQDALTGVYFDKNTAISVTKGGETLYFQNIDNRDRFLANSR